MRPLEHGYTNRTATDGAVVAKTYEGPGADRRLRAEQLLLNRLQGRLPVPPVRSVHARTLTLGFMAGVPGQELLEKQPEAVLTSCGEMLRRIHATPPSILGVLADDGGELAGGVLVHGDFGPQNVLLDPATCAVTAVVDWEFAHVGDPVEDLAWCEWIVRMHHPRLRPQLAAFFRAYGAPVPPWPVRRRAMLARCEELRRFCARGEPDGPGVRLWRERIVVTGGWQE